MFIYSCSSPQVFAVSSVASDGCIPGRLTGGDKDDCNYCRALFFFFLCFFSFEVFDGDCDGSSGSAPATAC